MRHPSAKPSMPHVQFRAAHLKDELDARRLPGESYGATVQWILRQYFDLMHRVDVVYGGDDFDEDGVSYDTAYEVAQSWSDDFERRRTRENPPASVDLRAPTRKIA